MRRGCVDWSTSWLQLCRACMSVGGTVCVREVSNKGHFVTCECFVVCTGTASPPRYDIRLLGRAQMAAGLHCLAGSGPASVSRLPTKMVCVWLVCVMPADEAHQQSSLLLYHPDYAIVARLPSGLHLVAESIRSGRRPPFTSSHSGQLGFGLSLHLYSLWAAFY